MSKSAMLRTRRRDVNVKPNRRLDRKSSRGMIYENEELRLRTININAEIERGQSDIKKLRRENEQLRKEIWCLRDEYEKLDKLLKEKGDRTSCSSCSSDTDSCTSCSESEDNETTQNIENVQKTTLNNLRTDFDHLSVVTEETSAENSDKNSNNASSPKQSIWDALPPDQSYPNSQTLPLPNTKSSLVIEQMPKHFFAPLKPSKSYENCQEDSCWKSNSSSWMQKTNFDQKPPILTPRTNLQNMLSLPPPPPLYDPNFLPPIPPKLALCARTNPDILVKTEPNFPQESTTNSFINGGNLDELLQDIQTISNDILQISAQHESKGFEGFEEDKNSTERPYKSELNVVLMPKSMPLLGFDKYQNIKSSLESLASIKKSVESLQMLDVPHTEINIPPPQNFTPFPTDFPTISRPLTPIPPPKIHQDLDRQSSNPFFFNSLDNYNNDRFKPESFAHDNFGFKNEIIQPNKPEEKVIKSNIDNEIVENKNKPDKEVKQSENEKKEPDKSPKSRRTRKVSIYFKGKKDKLARSLSLDTKMAQESPKSLDKTPITTPNLKNSSGESKTSLNQEASEKINSDTNKTSSDSKGSNYDRKHRKSSSTSPERKHVHIKPENEKKCNKKRHRKSDRRPATRRASLDRSFSVCTDRSNILDNKFGHFEDYTNSERDRSNSLSSCDTIKSRKMSAPPQFQVSGKIPWFGCWGNGCL